jgi:hypothetical protein
MNKLARLMVGLWVLFSPLLSTGPVQAAATINLAQGKPTAQSSTLPGSSASSDRAVDGNTDGNFSHGSVTHTNYDIGAWWQVDLGAIHPITSIDLWNRTDCCAERLRKIYVFVSDIPFQSNNLTDLVNQPGVWNSYTFDPLSAAKISVPVNRSGRYIRIQLGRTEYLSLAEVQVWGQTSVNLGWGKYAIQSSTLAGATSDRAVDGNTDGNFSHGSVTHTNYDIGAWWQIDLGAKHTLESIDIWNRTDCCAERLRKIYVFVSDTPFTTSNLSELTSQYWNSYIFDPQSAQRITVPVNRSGRYVRIQLGRTEYLSLAEVQIWGDGNVPPALITHDVNDYTFHASTGGSGGSPVTTYDLADYLFNSDPNATTLLQMYDKAAGVNSVEQTFHAYRSDRPYSNAFYIVKDRTKFEEWAYDDKYLYFLRDTTWQDANFCKIKDDSYDTSLEAWDSQSRIRGAKRPRFVQDGQTYQMPRHDIRARYEIGPEACKECTSDNRSLNEAGVVLQVRHYNQFYFDRTGVTLNDVIELKGTAGPGAGDTFYYARGKGWVGFEDNNYKSQYKTTIPEAPRPQDPCPNCGFGQPYASGRDRVATFSDGRLVVFARGTDNAIWYKWQLPKGGWSDWSSLSGNVISNPVVGANLDGHLELFAVNADHTMGHIWQDPNSTTGTGWSDWGNLGGYHTSEPAIGRNTSGALEVFARGSTNALYHSWQSAPNSSTNWSGWDNLGGSFAGDPAIGINPDGRLEAFMRTTDNVLWHKWQEPTSGWSNWYVLGDSLVENPTVAINQDGHLQVFAVRSDRALWTIAQNATTGWTSWRQLGGIVTSEATVGRNADGRLEVFMRGTTSALYHVWQSAANSDVWVWNTVDLGGNHTSDMFAARNDDGRLDVFARGSDNALYHILQNAPNSANWSGWERFGGLTLADF